MAKRFTDTEKWNRPWFRKLACKYKVFWQYITDNCDQVGVWYVDFELASMFIGEVIDPKEAAISFEKQIQVLDPSRWLIKDFISFQYGELKPTNNFHASLILRVEKLGVSEGLNSPSAGDKEKDKVKDKESLSLKTVNKTASTHGTEPTKPLTEVQKVVTVYKIVSGYEKEDKEWDRLYFSRFSKSAKQLIDFIGNWKDAADCVQDVYEKLNGKGLTVTLETVIKHAADWKKDKLEKEAKRNGVFPQSRT